MRFGIPLSPTKVVFIGKASQDVAAVIVIYEACLQQIKLDYPHIKYYYGSFIPLKYHWQKNAGLTFRETMFKPEKTSVIGMPRQPNSLGHYVWNQLLSFTSRTIRYHYSTQFYWLYPFPSKYSPSRTLNRPR